MRFLNLELDELGAGCQHDLAVSRSLAQARLIDKLFESFGQHLEAEGYIVRGGQIIDATIVSVPKQRNTKEENDHPSAGETRPTLPYQCNVLPPSLPIWRIQLPS